MSKFARLQVLGPVAVFAAVLVAEAAALALSQFPTSELLWRVNLELFGIFQKSQYLLSPIGAVPFSQLLVIALPLLALARFTDFCRAANWRSASPAISASCMRRS